MDEDFNFLFPFPDVNRGYTKMSGRRIRCKYGKCSKYRISLAKKNLGAQWPEVELSIDLPATCTTVARVCSNNTLFQRRW